VHRNRLVAYVVFEKLDTAGIEDPVADWGLILAQVPELTARVLHTMTQKGEAEYSGYTASLFKNATKTEHLAKSTIEGP
jgi:hypothetical protein